MLFISFPKRTTKNKSLELLLTAWKKCQVCPHVSVSSLGSQNFACLPLEEERCRPRHSLPLFSCLD
jgi:hypothetical protein